MLPILTVTVNPAIDMTTHVAALRPRQKLRCGAPVLHAGGGGINVSRAIKELGGESRAFVALGGHTGAQLEAILRGSGIVTDIWRLTGETRTSFTVMDDRRDLPYRFVMPGPTISTAETTVMLRELERTISHYPGYVVASGSLAPGMPMDFYAQLAKRSRALGCRFIVDTHGEALRAAAEERPFLIRLNHLEAQELVGGEPDRAAHILARELVDGGHAEAAIVALGERGAILSTREGAVEIRPPRVAMKSGVGAGDSFVGALTFALASGWSMTDAARYGVAAAASAVTTDATELCHRADVDAYFAQIEVSAVAA